jgi:hypothetical protein
VTEPLDDDVQWCAVCDMNPVLAKGLCRTCYAYRWRTGKQRPKRLADKQADLNYKKL